ncbi:Uma2 family endonuclease [Prosthecobacter sp.]|uniref:Uma2 family endonuclease n=1 Tax=Prosthecobacter sp. TaxID=1965333 RepID=UPI003904C34C
MIAGTTDTANTVDWDEDAIPRPDVSNLITEDDTPVDNQFSEKQMRLLTESIHASWRPGFPFVAMANVGVYVALNRPAIVPDVLVTTHVEPLQDLMNKEHKAYFSWIFDGKVPDVVIEIVSNTKGGELDHKLRNYQQMGVTWYAVFDPMHYLSEQTLTCFTLAGGKYRPHTEPAFGELGLGLLVWEGEYEGVSSGWLRWSDRDGSMLKTGQERATAEAGRAAAEAKRAAALAAKLRELGVDPDSIA